MGEPIIGAHPLPGGVLVVADQRPAVPVLPALQPAERTFRVVDDDAPATASALPLRDRAQLVTLPEAIAVVLELSRDFGFHGLASPRDQRIEQAGGGGGRGRPVACA